MNERFTSHTITLAEWNEAGTPAHYRLEDAWSRRPDMPLDSVLDRPEREYSSTLAEWREDARIAREIEADANPHTNLTGGESWSMLQIIHVLEDCGRIGASGADDAAIALRWAAGDDLEHAERMRIGGALHRAHVAWETLRAESRPVHERRYSRDSVRRSRASAKRARRTEIRASLDRMLADLPPLLVAVAQAQANAAEGIRETNWLRIAGTQVEISSLIASAVRVRVSKRKYVRVEPGETITAGQLEILAYACMPLDRRGNVHLVRKELAELAMSA